MKWGYALALCLGFFGCSEYKIQSTDQIVPAPPCDEDTGIVIIEPEPVLEPDIAVSPDGNYFGSMEVLDQEEFFSHFTIMNVGTDTLDLTDVYLKDPNSSYEIVDFSLDPLEPSEWTDMLVRFQPESAGSKNDQIVINSNDPDEPVVEVDLKGDGLAPMIRLTPEWYDFGETQAGCSEELEVLVENIGTSDLEVTQIVFSSTPDMELIINQSLYGALPWTIQPGVSIPLTVDYTGWDEDYDMGYINVTSNDPQVETAVAIQEGDARAEGELVDTFIQEETTKTDILFVIDNSCSMGEEQTNLALNADSFITFLEASGADFQIAVITTDNYAFRGPIITPTIPDIVGEFVYQVMAGVMGSPDEVGLEMAYKATTAGEAAGPGSAFLRPDALLSLVFISDEDDYSPQPVPDYITHFLTLKTDPSHVLIHAVAGEVPTTCMVAASGYRYLEAVSATAGLFLDICMPDWGVGLEALADGSVLVELDFELTEIPMGDMIEVYVNGVLTESGWYYDALTNSIMFDEASAPEGGDIIEVIYTYFGECPE